MKKLLKALFNIVIIFASIAIITYVFWGKDITIVDSSDPRYDEALYWPVPKHYRLSQELHSDGAIDVGDNFIENAPVYAAVGGTVTHTFHCEKNHEDEYADCNGFGTGLIIAGDDGRIYQYAHLYPDSMPVYVREGVKLKAGTLLGEVGNTGNSSGPHLHFEISAGSSSDDTVIDPQDEIYKDII